MPEFPPHISGEYADRIRYLIAGFIRDTLTEKEHDELDQWVIANDENLLLFEELTDDNNLEENLRFLEQLAPGKALKRIKTRAKFARPELKPFQIWSYAVAASLILGLVVFAFILLSRNIVNEPIKTVQQEIPDIQPGRNKATLTLADGSNIILTDVANGLLKTENGTRITKTGDGEISYDSGPSGNKMGGINILSVPKGGQYRVILPDGSKVWINALSVLKYPSSFSGKERNIEISGEAYFEVARIDSMPFKIRLPGESTVEVLGTSFNVMTYSDEPTQQTSLIEGSVKVINAGNTIIIKPGEQAVTDKQGRLRLVKTEDKESIIAWKNGNFDFKDASIETIMRQIERWYDVKVIYNTRVTMEFTAEVSRSEPVSRLLHLLELTNRVHFKIENKTIYVLP